jgi:NAD(P)-dependent dehydrogenase (short-subunit alcohol dehydrogenase family)
MRLQGKIAIITGAARGIGRAIALTVAKQGAVPVIVDIDETHAKEVAEEVQGLGISALSLHTDVSMVTEIEEMTNRVMQHFGKIDILVNNAAVFETTPIDNVSEREWDRIMAVNLKGPFFTCQHVLKHMRETGRGRIINISSLAGRAGSYEGGLLYGTSKAGIIGLTMSLARKVAKYNITVNAVAPGPTETDMLNSLPEESRARLKAIIPLKRFGKPENLAELVAFLASDSADFITGAVIDVNGGMFMG